MSSGRCKEIFSSAQAGACPCCSAVTSEFPGFECENSSVSTYSPGTVADFETVRRLVFSPLHVDPHGAFTPAAFHDALDKGASVDRAMHCSEADSHSRGASKEAVKRAQGNADVAYVGFASASVAEIRAIRATAQAGFERRVFGVYDSGIQENAAHADLCQGSGFDKAARRSIRELLWRVFGSRVEPPKN
jgi:hypothetical protein